MSTLIRSASFNPDVKFAPIDCVRVKAKNATYEAFDNGSSKTAILEVDCPWGSQTIANNLLTKYKGCRYQGYEATDAILNFDFYRSSGTPLNKTLSMYGVYSAIYSIHYKGGLMFAVDIAAPSNNL